MSDKPKTHPPDDTNNEPLKNQTGKSRDESVMHPRSRHQAKGPRRRIDDLFSDMEKEAIDPSSKDAVSQTEHLKSGTDRSSVDMPRP